MKIKKEKKIRVLKLILYITVGVCLIYNILFLLSTTITQKDYFKLFGITFFKMENDLMENDISKNDLVIVKKIKEKDLKEGDIIAYTVNGKTRINKIINIDVEYTTMSNKNYYPDVEKVTNNQIIGKMIVSMPFLGVLIETLQSKIISIIIFLFLIFYFLYNKYIYTKMKERARKKKKMTIIS